MKNYTTTVKFYSCDECAHHKLLIFEVKNITLSDWFYISLTKISLSSLTSRTRYCSYKPRINWILKNFTVHVRGVGVRVPLYNSRPRTYYYSTFNIINTGSFHLKSRNVFFFRWLVLTSSSIMFSQSVFWCCYML